MSTKTKPRGRVTPKGTQQPKRGAAVAKKRPHIMAIAKEANLPNIQGLVVAGNQVAVRCTTDGWMCICPKENARWNFDKHVLEAQGKHVPTDQEREEMAFDFDDPEALKAAGMDDEGKKAFHVDATDKYPAFDTTIFMKKSEYLADPADLEERGWQQYKDRSAIIDAPQPEPSRTDQIAELRTQLASMAEQLERLEAEAAADAALIDEPVVTVPGAVAPEASTAPDVVTPAAGGKEKPGTPGK